MISSRDPLNHKEMQNRIRRAEKNKEINGSIRCRFMRNCVNPSIRNREMSDPLVLTNYRGECQENRKKDNEEERKQF